MPTYALVKANNPEEWLIRLPGGRLDPWGSIIERVEFPNLDSAQARRRIERAERYADIVEIPDNVKDLRTYTVVDAHDPNLPHYAAEQAAYLKQKGKK
jgi:hypothetical protein